MKRWIIQSEIDPSTPDRTDAIVNILLKNRGLSDETSLKNFFSLKDPLLLSFTDIGISEKSVKAAIKRLKQAKKKQEKIVIAGDYDADGITATAILWETLYKLGFQVMPFLPHREKHGYGLKPKTIDALIEESGKPDLIITVDNGIVAQKGASYCNKLGIDLIITDHHEASLDADQKPVLPECISAIHSTQTSGAGVSLLFARELLKTFEPDADHREFLSSLVELATIGIVADLVPMLSVSRTITKAGLERLPQTQRPGLKALFAESKLDLAKPLDTYHIGFVIAPRLNAMGRLEHCLDSLRLLCTKDSQKAVSLALSIGSVNKLRQEMTHDNVTLILETIKKSELKKLIITSSEDYNPGVIGLIAGRITEQFARPSIAIAVDKEFAKGSVRSVPGVNIIEFLRKFSDEFLELGGHQMAAGFTVCRDNVPNLIAKLEAEAETLIDESLLESKLIAETEINLDDVSFQLHSKVSDFAPFGIGNPRPVFVSKNVTVLSVYAMGKARNHLKLLIQTSSQPLEAVFFSAYDWIDSIHQGDRIDIAYYLDMNEWNGSKKLQLMLKDIHPTP